VVYVPSLAWLAAPHRVITVPPEVLSAWAAGELPDWAAELAWIINARTP
jgi:hypothetical protein